MDANIQAKRISTRIARESMRAIINITVILRVFGYSVVHRVLGQTASLTIDSWHRSSPISKANLACSDGMQMLSYGLVAKERAL